MRIFLSKTLVVGLLLVLAPASQACWWPFFPAYGAGYAPWAPTYAGYGPSSAGYYGGYPPVSYASYAAPVNYAPAYSAGYASYSSASYSAGGCAVACCDPCTSCGSACGPGCVGAACGAACTGVETGTLRPAADPISNTGTGRTRDSETRDPRDERDPLDERDRRSTPRGYESPTDEGPGSRGTFENDTSAPLFNDDTGRDMFGPSNESTGIGGARGSGWGQTQDRSGTPAQGSGNAVDDILNQRLDDQFPEFRRTNRPPITEPVEEDGSTDDTSDGTAAEPRDAENPESDNDATAPVPPASDLGREVSPQDFVSPPTSEDENAAVRPLMMAQGKLRSNHFDVISVRRLAAESRDPQNGTGRPDTHLSDTTSNTRPLRWISVPAPAGRVRL